MSDIVIKSIPDSKLVGAKNPRWGDAEKTTIFLECKFSHYEAIGATDNDGYLPFTAKPDDPEEHGRLIFEKAKAGDYGTIADYVAPSHGEDD
tara:strand:+ start:5998 stop:6273 length:276 start_codon:yes stop_codon:yes gene_type:complete